MAIPPHSEAATFANVFPRATVAIRWTAAIVISGAFAAFAWMFALQEGHTGQIFGRKWTDSNFPTGLANALGFDPPNRRGLILCIGLGVLAALTFAAFERWLPGRGWRKGLTFAALPFLLWSLVFTPLVNSREVLVGDNIEFLPTGAFGSGAGRGTVVSALVASLMVGVILARFFPLMRNATWWAEHPESHRPSMDVDELLELPKERTKEGGERPGA